MWVYWGHIFSDLKATLDLYLLTLWCSSDALWDICLTEFMQYWHTSSQTCWKGQPLWSSVRRLDTAFKLRVTMTSIFRHDIWKCLHEWKNTYKMIRYNKNIQCEFNKYRNWTRFWHEDWLKKTVSSGWLHRFDHLCTVK